MSDVNAYEFDASNASGDSVDWDSVPESSAEVEASNEEASNEIIEESGYNEEENVSEDSGAVDSFEEDDEQDIESSDNEVDNDEPEAEDKEDSEESEAQEEVSLEEIQKQLEDGSYKLEINGEEVSLQDMKNDYIGQKEVARRFTQLDQERKEYQAEVQEVEQYINEFAAKMQDGDSVGAMAYFGQFAGIPPYMVKEQLIAALQPEMMRRMEMSATELQNEQLAEQNNYLKELNESDARRRESEQANMELTQSINSLRETHGIGAEEWSEAESFLRENVADANEITPEIIGEYVQNVRAYDKAESILTDMSISLEGNDAFIDTFQTIIRDNPDFTDEDLKQLVEQSKSEAQKTEVKKDLEKKISKGAPKAQKKQEAKQQNQISEIDADDWDDLF